MGPCKDVNRRNNIYGIFYSSFYSSVISRTTPGKNRVKLSIRWRRLSLAFANILSLSFAFIPCYYVSTNISETLYLARAGAQR